MPYRWDSDGRTGSGKKKPNYAVKWEWRNPDLAGSYRQMTDLTNATNAERAINKVRNEITKEYNCSRGQIIIISVVPIEGMSSDA